MKNRYWLVLVVVTVVVVAGAVIHQAVAYCVGGNSCGGNRNQT